MKTISVGELRQNPAPMIADLETGELYTLTHYNRPIATILPRASSATITPAKRSGGARTVEIPRHETSRPLDELLAEMKGDW